VRAALPRVSDQDMVIGGIFGGEGETAIEG